MMHFLIRPSCFAASLAILTTGCSSAPEAKFDPELEEQKAAERIDQALIQARQSEFKRVLTNMDGWLQSYATALLNSGAPKSDAQAKKIERHIRSWVGPPEYIYFREFLAAATQVEFPRNRTIALAALGFSSSREALDPLLNALGDSNVQVVDNAVFGLSILKDPRTPPSYLARVINNEDYESVMRAGAAWSLYQIQTASTDVEEFVKVWHSLLDVPLQDVVPAVAVSALRGLGRTRQPAHARLVERYVSHPSPKVREATAIAIGRMGDQESFEPLIALIGPAESVPNVRLAASKALKALAGGVDLGYDVDEWRAVFQRN